MTASIFGRFVVVDKLNISNKLMPVYHVVLTAYVKGPKFPWVSATAI